MGGWDRGREVEGGREGGRLREGGGWVGGTEGGREVEGKLLMMGPG